MNNLSSIHSLITHVNPDLDAIMGIFLLREFGESLIPNIRSLPVMFVSAGNLPQGKSASQLEKEGFLCVDVGGGRFDNHPTATKLNKGKVDLSAVELIARKLKIKDSEWRELIEYTRLQDTRGHHLYSTVALHHSFSLLSIMEGIRILYPGDDLKKLTLAMRLLGILRCYLPVKNRKKTFRDEILPFIKRYLAEKNINAKDAPPHYQVLLGWGDLLEKDDPSIFSRNKLDDLVTIKAILVGLHHTSDLTQTEKGDVVNLCFDAILAREEKWSQAKENFLKHRKVYDIGRYEVVIVDSNNGLMIKAARFFNQPDILLFRDSNSRAVSFLLGKKGKLSKDFNRGLATRIRIAEAYTTHQSVSNQEYDRIGNIEGWFLHQSLALLLRGSPKSPSFEPTKMDFSLISNILLMQVALQERSDYHLEYEAEIPSEILSEFMRFDLQKLG